MNAPTTAQHLMPVIALRDVPQVLIDTLKAHFGDRCSTALSVREHHGRDESAYTTVPPPAADAASRRTGRSGKVAAAVAVLTLAMAARAMQRLIIFM